MMSGAFRTYGSIAVEEQQGGRGLGGDDLGAIPRGQESRWPIDPDQQDLDTVPDGRSTGSSVT